MSSGNPIHRCRLKDWRFARPAASAALARFLTTSRCSGYGKISVPFRLTSSSTRLWIACESSRESFCQGSMSGFALSQSFAMKGGGAGFLARQEYRSHLDGLCAQSQRRDYASCISYSPAAITGTSTMSTTCGTSDSVPVSESSAGRRNEPRCPLLRSRKRNGIHACFLKVLQPRRALSPSQW
jgi:hypothetical protein